MQQARLVRSALAFSTFALLLLLMPCSFGGPQQDADWTAVPAIMKRISAPVFPARDFRLTEFGAVADGKTDATEAFRKAIAACGQAGGGRVVVPPGRFLTGAIHLRSNVNLHLEDGATILFSQNPDHYLPVAPTFWEGVQCMNYSALIYANDQQNIAVTGAGTLDGQADAEHWWPWKGQRQHGWKQGMPNQAQARAELMDMNAKQVPPEKRIFGAGRFLRPNFIQFYNCRNILVEAVKIIRSPMWEIHPVLCRNVIVRNVSIASHGPNNDGCDPEATEDMLIEGCTFDTGDDCIAIKSGRNEDGRRLAKPSQNIIVRNCQMKDGHGGIVIGSEVSGGCRNVFVEGCAMDSPNLDRVLRIKTNSARGGTVENICLRDIQVGQVSESIVHVNFNYEEGDKGQFAPTVKKIRVARVRSAKSQFGLFLIGYERSPVSDIVLEDCDFSGVASGNRLEHVEGLVFKNVKINGIEQRD